MSEGRRFWLPTRKGTELFPQVTQQPTKLVIEGVPTGTPLYRVVAAHFAGQLKQFHSKAQADYSLSENRQMRRHIEWTGARATYINQSGQETLTLQVDAHVLEELKQPRKGRWNWALVNFEFPMVNDPTCTIYAVVRGTHLDTLQTSGGVNQASTYWHNFKAIAFAGTGDDTSDHLDAHTETDTTMQRFSLLIDLRIVAQGAVVVDVFASATKQVGSVVAWNRSLVPPNTLVEWYTDHFITDYFAKRDDNINQYEAAGFSSGWGIVGNPVCTGDQTNIGDAELDLQLFVGDIVTIPIAGYVSPTINTFPGPPCDASIEGRRQVAVTYDALGRIITYASSSISWRDSTHFLGVAYPYATRHYTYTDVLAYTDVPDRGPGRVTGIAFEHDDPRWVWREWDIDSGHHNYRWMPSTVEGPNWVNFATLDDSVLWPDTINVQPNDPRIFLGTIIANVDNGGLVFRSASG